MSAPKLTPPADAPKIPKGWVYMGAAWESKVPVRYAFWDADIDEWIGCYGKSITEGERNRHYITPAPKRAKKKAVKRASRLIEARSAYGLAGDSMLFMSAGAAKYFAGFSAENVTRFHVLPADDDSVARMVEQVADVLADAYALKKTSIEVNLARAVLAAIGITGKAGK